MDGRAPGNLTRMTDTSIAPVAPGLLRLDDDGIVLLGGWSPTSGRAHFPLAVRCPWTGADDVEPITVRRGARTDALADPRYAPMHPFWSRPAPDWEDVVLLPLVSGREFFGELHVHLPAGARFGDDDAIDQDSRNLDLARRQPAAFGDPFDLGDDDPVAVLGRHRHGEIVERQGFPFHRDVAESIGGRTAHEGDVDLADLVEQPLLAIDFDQTDETLIDEFGS